MLCGLFLVKDVTQLSDNDVDSGAVMAVVPAFVDKLTTAKREMVMLNM